MPDRFLQKAEEKLHAARVLFENGLYEDAVGRAYYCMYFATKAIFLTRNIDVKTHKGLLRGFFPAITLKLAFADQLFRLR